MEKNLVWNGKFLVWYGRNFQNGIWKNHLLFHSTACPDFESAVIIAPVGYFSRLNNYHEPGQNDFP